MKYSQIVNKSLLRAIAVLKCFSLEENELGPANISKKAGIPISTVHRILVTLTQSGLLEQDEKTNRYTIGPDIYSLGSIYMRTTDLYRAANPVVNLLSDITKEAITVGTFDSNRVTYIIFKESTLVLRAGLHVGSVSTAYPSAIGRVFLSKLSNEEIDKLYPLEELIKRTKYSIGTKAELMVNLKKIRETGISFDSQGTFEGIDGIATGIHDADGKVVAVLGIALPTTRMNKARFEHLSKLVKMGASIISYRLGYIDADNPAPSLEGLRSLRNQVN